MTVTLPTNIVTPELADRIGQARAAVADTRDLLTRFSQVLAEYQEKHFLATRGFSDAATHVGDAWRALGYADITLAEVTGGPT